MVLYSINNYYYMLCIVHVVCCGVLALTVKWCCPGAILARSL